MGVGVWGRLALLGGVALLPRGAVAEQVNAAGSALPRAVYGEWAKAYGSKSPFVLAYSVMSPVEAVRDVGAAKLDFGASEMPLPVEQLAAKGLVQFPTVIGGVVPVVNIPGVVPGALALTGPILAQIFLGRIATWNDPAIEKLNPELSLPARPIRVVHPADASGSTFLFTMYLSTVDADWRARVGSGFTVKWPVGEERPGSEAVGQFVLRTMGAIGFVDFAHAEDQGLPRAKLRNRSAEFVTANTVSFQAAAANAPWESTPGFALLLVDPPGKGSWPLTAPAFAFLPYAPKDPSKVESVLKFFDWSFKNGSAIASASGCVALPESVKTLVENAWRRQIKTREGKPVWSTR